MKTFAVGPEDLGKHILAPRLGLKGILTCYTSLHVWLFDAKTMNRPLRIPRELVIYDPSVKLFY